MGVWDFINSSIHRTKQNAPNLSSIKNACWNSYNYSSNAVEKIDKAVRVDGIQRLYSYWPDGEARAKIGLFATKFTANAVDYGIHEGVKLLPGGKAVSKIVSQTIRDVKCESNKTQQVRAVETKVGCGADSIACSNSMDQSELLKQDAKLSSRNVYEYEKPEDVITNFMVNEFVGNRILADLMVTRTHCVKKKFK